MKKQSYYSADYFTESALKKASAKDFDPDKIEYQTVTGATLGEVVSVATAKNFHKGECYSIQLHFWNGDAGTWDYEPVSDSELADTFL